MQFLSENRLSICQIFICFSFLNWIWTDFRFSTHPVHWQQGHAPIINTPPCVTSVHWQQGHHRDHIQTVQTCHDSLQVSAVQGLAPSYLADDVSWPRLLPVDDICSLPTPWTGLVRRAGLSSAPETLWFGRSHLEQSTSSFETVFLLGSDICTETENFLFQRDDVAHMRTIYFVLYKYTHYYYYYYYYYYATFYNESHGCWTIVWHKLIPPYTYDSNFWYIWHSHKHCRFCAFNRHRQKQTEPKHSTLSRRCHWPNWK